MVLKYAHADKASDLGEVVNLGLCIEQGTWAPVRALQEMAGKGVMT